MKTLIHFIFSNEISYKIVLHIFFLWCWIASYWKYVLLLMIETIVVSSARVILKFPKGRWWNIYSKLNHFIKLMSGRQLLYWSPKCSILSNVIVKGLRTARKTVCVPLKKKYKKQKTQMTDVTWYVSHG